MILAIDPGSEQSAWLVLGDDRQPVDFSIQSNETIVDWIEESEPDGTETLAIEMISSYGMPVGRTVFETCVWIGRFIQAWTGPHAFVYRREVKLHLCNSSRAKDGNVRAALIDQYGGDKRTAVGVKKEPGPLYGISKDVWAALGVAVTYHDNGSQ